MKLLKRKKQLLSIGLTILLAGPPALLRAQVWEKPSQPPAVEPLQTLASHPLQPNGIVASSDHQIFEKRSDGTWKNFGFHSAAGNTIHRLVALKETPHSLYALTRDGAYRYDFRTRRWAQIYRGQKASGKSVLSFAILPEDPDHWFLGTEAGLLESDDAGKTWFPFPGLKKEPVSVLKFFGDQLFAGIGHQLYRSKDLSHFRVLFSLLSRERLLTPEVDGLTGASDAETEEVFMQTPVQLFELVGLRDKPETLWLATEKGVFESGDNANSWHALPQSGLRSLEVRHLIYSEKASRIFAGTPRGIYGYDATTKKWQEVRLVTSGAEIRGLSLLQTDGKEILAAVTNTGFIEAPLWAPEIPAGASSLSGERLALYRQLIREEPAVREVHKAVIRYGDLSNWKIKRWHGESRLAALLPSFSFGRNLDRNASITTYSGKYITGPEDISEGWDAGVSWDLGDLIWSSNQTSIDSREKMMVELRNDFLAEATRLYYERRRLQTEIVFSPAPSEQEHLDRLTRMDELTALLDGMSDGFFSRKLERLYAQSPSFDRLWIWNAPQESSRT